METITEKQLQMIKDSIDNVPLLIIEDGFIKIVFKK